MSRVARAGGACGAAGGCDEVTAGALDRRSFLARVRSLAAGAACAGFPLSMVGCASLPRARPTFTDETASFPLTDFGEGRAVVFPHPTEPRPVHVHRDDSGGFTAVLLHCTHRGCEVDPFPDELVCPCHGSRFSPSGEVLDGPADRPLTPYPVTSDSVHVHVRLRSGAADS